MPLRRDQRRASGRACGRREPRGHAPTSAPGQPNRQGPHGVLTHYTCTYTDSCMPGRFTPCAPVATDNSAMQPGLPAGASQELGVNAHDRHRPRRPAGTQLTRLRPLQAPPPRPPRRRITGTRAASQAPARLNNRRRDDGHLGRVQGRAAGERVCSSSRPLPRDAHPAARRRAARAAASRQPRHAAPHMSAACPPRPPRHTRLQLPCAPPPPLRQATLRCR